MVSRFLRQLRSGESNLSTIPSLSTYAYLALHIKSDDSPKNHPSPTPSVSVGPAAGSQSAKKAYPAANPLCTSLPAVEPQDRIVGLSLALSDSPSLLLSPFFFQFVTQSRLPARYRRVPPQQANPLSSITGIRGRIYGDSFCRSAPSLSGFRIDRWARNGPHKYLNLIVLPIQD